MQERLIRLLEAVAGSAEPVSANELSKMLDLPRATLYRNIATLLECGFLDQTNNETRYVLGLRFVKIALTGKSDGHVINAVSSVMHKLANELGETAFMARYRGGRVDLVHNEIPSDQTLSHIYPGLGPRPIHACSSAKAIAAYILPELRREVMEKNPLRFNSKTIVDPELIEQELTRVRHNGYAICDGEIDEGVASVAVPVNVDRLGAIFSIGIVGPSHRIKPNIENRILPFLTQEAVRASAAIQHCSISEAEAMTPEAAASEP